MSSISLVNSNSHSLTVILLHVKVTLSRQFRISLENNNKTNNLASQCELGLEFQKCPPSNQLHGDFIPLVSAIDRLGSQPSRADASSCTFTYRRIHIGLIRPAAHWAPLTRSSERRPAIAGRFDALRQMGARSIGHRLQSARTPRCTARTRRVSGRCCLLAALTWPANCCWPPS